MTREATELQPECQPPRSGHWRVLLRDVVIVGLLTLVVGGLAAFKRGHEHVPAGAPAEGTTSVLTLADFQEFVSARRGVVLDARPPAFYRLGHVPGALSLSHKQFEQDFLTQKPVLDRDRAQPIAIYCSGPSCDDNVLVSLKLIERGYLNVQLFPGGWEAWTQAGLAVERP